MNCNFRELDDDDDDDDDEEEHDSTKTNKQNRANVETTPRKHTACSGHLLFWCI